MLASYSQTLAVINEDHCIGCTLCIKACPFDAIIGAAKQLHTVVNAYCTGCKLCIAPCPVDCISMQPNTELSKHEYPPPTLSSHTACTQCGECVPVCPSKLNPENLYSLISSKKSHQAESHNLKSCTLCRKCDDVCPSHIPLSETFSYAINVLQFKSNKTAFTKGCKQRMQNKEIRLHKKQNEQLSQLSANKENLADKLQALKHAKPKNS